MAVAGVPGPRGPDPDGDALERSVLVGIAAFRWVVWVWMAVVLALDIRNGPFARPVPAVVLAGAALAWTVTASALARRTPAALLAPAALAVELAIAAALLFADGWVYGADNPHSQSFGSAWPMAGILTVGVALGWRAGAAAGGVLGLVGVAGRLTFDGLTHGDDQVGAIGTVVFYALAGGIAGFVVERLRRAEREVALARAREEVARTLHDGVLQTLAIVQRRTADDDLVALARDQERDLRAFLYDAPGGSRTGSGGRGRTDLVVELRRVADDAERRDGLRTTVVSGGEAVPVAEAVARALAGAVREALTNAAKHGRARTATVFVEVEDRDVFCSVKDDGAGFDPSTTAEGAGIRSSIRGRLAEVGGEATVDGRPGRGTEVRLRAARSAPGVGQ